jgi:hypothetical protein
MVAATLPHLEKATTQRTLPILPTTNSRFAIFTMVFSVNKAFTSSISSAIAPNIPMFLVINSKIQNLAAGYWLLATGSFHQDQEAQ